MKDGFLKAAALSPALRVADCTYNVRQITDALHKAAARGVKLAVFPEFCLTGYTCGDLFLQRTLQTGALDALSTLLDETKALDVVTLVGLPLLVHGKLYNCAAVLCHGRILGLVPKTYLPNYGEFYEKRQFTPGSTEVELVEVCGQQVPFGTSLLFRCRQMPSFVLGVEICEDLWSALPPSTFHALAGATVIANLSASDETVGKAEYRRALVSNQSARLLCGYLYASAGHGESTQDMVFAGHDLIAENGTILSENAPFDGGCAETEIDCQRMEAERARNTSFELSGEGYQTVEFDLEPAETTLTRWIDPAPFVPGDPKRRAERCELILKMQADGLAKRLEHAHAKTAVIGISGGLDSCLALLVAVRAMKQLGRPARDVLAVTMPCFGTTKRTRSNAEILCDELQVSFKEIDIANTVRSHFADIGQDESVLDVTFENGQARVRTLELMDTANDKLTEARAEYDSQKGEAERQFAEAETKLADAQQQLDAAKAQLEAGEKELAAQKAALPDTMQSGADQLVSSEEQVLEFEEQLQQIELLVNLKKVADPLLTYAEAALRNAEKALDEAEPEDEDYIELRDALAKAQAAYDNIYNQLQGYQQQLDAGKRQMHKQGLISSPNLSNDQLVTEAKAALRKMKLQLLQGQLQLTTGTASAPPPRTFSRRNGSSTLGTRPAYTGVPSTTRSDWQKFSSCCRTWGRVKSRLRQGAASSRASSPAMCVTVRSVVPVPLKYTAQTVVMIFPLFCVFLWVL